MQQSGLADWLAPRVGEEMEHWVESVNFTSNLVTNLVRYMEAEGHHIPPYP